MITDNMDALLADLKAVITRKSNHAFFGTPASAESITAVERAIGRQLPDAYKRFLSRHDGGFISDIPLKSEGRDHDTAAWNSTFLLPCEDIVRQYTEAKAMAEDVAGESLDWPYVPFCHTSGQELLVFGPPDTTGTQAVLDAFHECGPDDWRELSPDFQSFFESYICNEGSPPTIA